MTVIGANQNPHNAGKRFRKAGEVVLNKVIQLRQCKKTVKQSVLELSNHTSNLNAVLTKLGSDVEKLENRRKFLHTSGVAATTVGSSLAAILWAMAYVNEEEDGYCTPLAWLATGVGIGGTVVKLGTTYFCSTSNQGYMKELQETVGSKHGKYLSETEITLNSKFTEMIQLLKDLYGKDQERSSKKKSSDHSLLHHRGGSLDGSVEVEDDEGAPLVISLMETADSASVAPDVISTVLEYSSDFGLESMEALEQTYNAATTSLGEVISYGLLEGAVNGLAVVLSTYEIYRLVGAWNKVNPTATKIDELIANVQKKFKVYSNLKKCMEIVDAFTSLKTLSNLKSSTVD